MSKFPRSQQQELPRVSCRRGVGSLPDVGPIFLLNNKSYNLEKKMRIRPESGQNVIIFHQGERRTDNTYLGFLCV